MWTFMKTKRNRKWKILQAVLERQTLCFSSFNNCKLWCVGTRKRKKREFFVPFIFPKGSFFNICVLSQRIVYWTHYQNIHLFKYQRALLFTLYTLFLKSLRAFSVSSILFATSFLNLTSSFSTCAFRNFISSIKTIYNYKLKYLPVI